MFYNAVTFLGNVENGIALASVTEIEIWTFVFCTKCARSSTRSSAERIALVVHEEFVNLCGSLEYGWPDTIETVIPTTKGFPNKLLWHSKR